MVQPGDHELLCAACCVAGVDGEVHKNERRLLQILATKVGVSSEALDVMIEQARTDPTYYKHQLEVLKTDPVKAMNILTTTAIADHVLLTEERIILRHLGEKMGLQNAYIDRVLDAAEKAAEQQRRQRDQKDG